MPNYFSCCCPSAAPEFSDAAQYLTAQADALLTDHLCPALSAATPANIVYGTKFDTMPRRRYQTFCAKRPTCNPAA